MTITNQVRQEIIAGNIKNAFETLAPIIEPNVSNEYTLLRYQFNDWSSRERLGENKDKIERNRIVYALLSLVSEIETQKSLGNKTTEIGKYESALKNGYEKLQKLQESNDLDSLMEWIYLSHKKEFDSILSMERQGTRLEIISVLESISYKYFVKEYKSNLSPESIESFIITNARNDSSLFTDWLEFKIRKIQMEKQLLSSINKIERSYKSILVNIGYSVVGGILATGIYEWLDNDDEFESEIDVDID